MRISKDRILRMSKAKRKVGDQQPSGKLERVTRFELATPCSGSKCSTIVPPNLSLDTRPDLYPVDSDWSEAFRLAFDLSRDRITADKPNKTPPAGIVIIKPKQKTDIAPETVLELWSA